MAELRRMSVDAVDELRLRRWARQHYVTADQRDESWHPIVLDEMGRRDLEHRLEMGTRLQSGIVPLAPHIRPTSPLPDSTTAGNLLFRIDTVLQPQDSHAD